MKSQSWLWSLIAVLVLAGGSYGVFVLFGEEPLPQGIVYGNGHIEGREVRIAAEVAISRGVRVDRTVEAQVLADVLAVVLLPRGAPARGQVLDALDLTRKPGHRSNPSRHTFGFRL